MRRKELKILGLSYSQSQIGSYVLVLSEKKGNKKIWKFESNLQEKSLPKQSDTNQIFTASRYLSEGFRNLKIEILEDNSDQWLPNVLIRIPKISLVKDAQIKIISDGFLRCSSSEIFSESTMYQLGRDTVGDQRDMYQNSADGYWEINLISNNKFVLNTNSMMGNFTQSYWTLKCLIRMTTRFIMCGKTMELSTQWQIFQFHQKQRVESMWRDQVNLRQRQSQQWQW
jgi:hypothetical protein